MNTIFDIVSFIIDYCYKLDDVAQQFTVKNQDFFWGDTELPFWIEGDEVMMVTHAYDIRTDKIICKKVSLGHIDNLNNFISRLNKKQLDVFCDREHEVTYDSDGDSEMYYILDNIEF